MVDKNVRGSGRAKKRVNPLLLLGESDNPVQNPTQGKVQGRNTVQSVDAVPVSKTVPSGSDASNLSSGVGSEEFGKPVRRKVAGGFPSVATSMPVGKKKTSGTGGETGNTDPSIPVSPTLENVGEVDAVNGEPLPQQAGGGLPVTPGGEKNAPVAPTGVESPFGDKSPLGGVEEAGEVPVAPVGGSGDGKRRVNPLFGLGEVEPEQSPARVFRVNPVVSPGQMGLPVLPKRDTSKPFTVKEDGLPRSQYTRRIDSVIEVEEWTDDKSTDTAFGLGGENDSAEVKPQYEKGFSLTERDITIIRFLTRYRYANTDQVARLVDSTPRNISARLRTLEKRGFIRRQSITDRQYLWVTRKAGNVLVDMNFPEIKKGAVSYITLPHTLGLSNLGVEFERSMGGKDLLGEGKGNPDWVTPENRWKFGIWGHPDGLHQGYMTVTEREIRQAQLRSRGGRDTKEMRDMVNLVASNSEPVELEEGQESMFVIYGAGGSVGEHIPDLVVVKERDDNGKPQHLAIELELTPKQPADWKRILRNFRDNGEMYAKVIYFTHKRSIANGILKADQEVGLGDRLVMRKYLPSSGSLPFWG